MKKNRKGLIMKLKKLLCIASLMMLVFLVGCKKEEKLDIADLQYNWVFVEIEAGGESTPHTPGLEAKEPSISFSGSSAQFSLNGKTNPAIVEASTDCYNFTFTDGSRKPMVGKLSDDGSVLTLSWEELGVHITFNKQ